MNRLWDMMKKMMRVLCVTVFFPGVDVDFDSIDQYLGIASAREKMEKMKIFFKRIANDNPLKWEEWRFLQR